MFLEGLSRSAVNPAPLQAGMKGAWHCAERRKLEIRRGREEDGMGRKEGGKGMGWGGGGREGDGEEGERGMGEEGRIRRKRSSRTCIASRSIPGVVLVQVWYLTASTRAFSPSSEISLPGNEVGVWVFGVTCIPSLERLRDSAKLTKVAFPVRCGHPSLSTTPSRRGCGCSAMSSCSRKHPMELNPMPTSPSPFTGGESEGWSVPLLPSLLSFPLGFLASGTTHRERDEKDGSDVCTKTLTFLWLVFFLWLLLFSRVVLLEHMM